MRMKTLTLVIVCLCAESVRAQFTGLDDFAGASKNSLKWGPDNRVGSGLLSVSGDGVLRYSLSGSANNEDLMEWPWIVGHASFSKNWCIQVDVHVPVIPLPPGYTAVGMGIGVSNSADPNDSFGANLENVRSDGPQELNFHTDLEVNGSTPADWISSVPSPSTNAAVRIAWDAGTRILSASYDTNGPVGGYTWTTFRTFNPVPSTNWNMSGTETFKIFVRGYSEGTTVTLSNNVYADNLIIFTYWTTHGRP